MVGWWVNMEYQINLKLSVFCTYPIWSLLIHSLVHHSLDLHNCKLSNIQSPSSHMHLPSNLPSQDRPLPTTPPIWLDFYHQSTFPNTFDHGHQCIPNLYLSLPWCWSYNSLPHGLLIVSPNSADYIFPVHLHTSTIIPSKYISTIA